jgi:hypothetical protein
MIMAVSLLRELVAAEAGVQSQASQCGVYVVEKVALGQVSSECYTFTLPISFQECFTLIQSTISSI